MDTTHCETCGKEFRPRQRTKPNRYCSQPCYHAGMRGVAKTEGTNHRMRKAHGHPLAPPSGTVAIARINLYDKIGAGPHPCHWCGTMLEWAVGKGPVSGTILADHLDHNSTDDSPENLVPACTQCNAHRTRKGDRRRIQDDEPFIVLSNGLRTRAFERECEWCGKTFLSLPAYVKKGKGRFCSFECGREGMRSRKHF